ncbi:hypothetical protein ACFE04_020316 [Oxalis oulophora]
MSAESEPIDGNFTQTLATNQVRLVDVNMKLGEHQCEEKEDVTILDSVAAARMINPSEEDMLFEGSDSEEVSDAVESMFVVNDLVWGKVMSHPWWPGQILDLSVASTKAKKYLKKDKYLIAYFSDKSFAWNNVSQIKKFSTCFERMDKQSKSENFLDAVNCALEEVSRRVEYGLACRCTPKDVYARIKTQIIDNAGVNEEARKRDDVYSFSAVDFFKPASPVVFIKHLALQPLGGVKRLEFTEAQAQLLAFYRWKGYSQLPEFKMLGGLLDSNVDNKVTEIDTPVLKSVEQVPRQKGNSERQSVSSQKRKKISDNNLHHGEKEESLSEVIAKKRLLNSDKLISSSSGQKHKMVDQTDDPAGKFMKTELSLKGANENSRPDKLISSSSGRKCKMVEQTDDPVDKFMRSELSSEAAIKNSQPDKTFLVGNSVVKAASQLNKSSSSLISSQKAAIRKIKSLPRKSPMPGGMLSHLRLSAVNPMGENKVLISMVNFFSEYRDSICLDSSNSRNDESPEKQQMSMDKNEQEKINHLEKNEEACIGRQEDSVCTEKIINCEPEKQPLYNNEFSPGLASVEVIATPEKEKVMVQLDVNSVGSSSVHLSPVKELEADKIVGPVNEDSNEVSSSPALILNFSDFNLIPSERDLNKIFSRYGPLFESKTQVLKKSNRATVVFKKRDDAETAFSSAGKYSIFGPALVSYRLRFVQVKPVKASSNPRRRKMATTSVKEANPRRRRKMATTSVKEGKEVDM